MGVQVSCCMGADFTCGRYGESTPETTEFYHELLTGSKLTVFEKSTHMAMLEEPEDYIQAVRSFLRQIE